MIGIIAIALYVGCGLAVWSIVEWMAYKIKSEMQVEVSKGVNFFEGLTPIGKWLFAMTFGTPSVWCICLLFGCPAVISAEVDIFLVTLIVGVMTFLGGLRIANKPSIQAVLVASTENQRRLSRKVIGGAIIMFLIGGIGFFLVVVGVLPET